MVKLRTDESNHAFDPFIKASFELRGPLFVVLVIQNIGKNAAIDVQLEFSLEPGNFKRNVVFPLLMPSQRVRFLLPEGNIKVITEKFTTLKLKGECKNIAGRKIPIDDRISVKKILNSWIQSKILLEESIENRLSQVADKIERLERSIERMVAATGGVLVKTPQDQKEELEEMKRRYEQRASKSKKKIFK